MTGNLPSREELMEVLQQTRGFLEPRWSDWKAQNEPRRIGPDVISARMCGFSALFVREALAESFPLGCWAIHGGCASFHPADPGWSMVGPVGQGGMLNLAGKWNDHYWLAGKSSGGPVILDITADQFGHAPIIVTGKDDPRYLRNWRDSFVRRHRGGVEVRVSGWLTEWRDEPEIEEGHALGM